MRQQQKLDSTNRGVITQNIDEKAGTRVLTDAELDEISAGAIMRIAAHIIRGLAVPVINWGWFEGGSRSPPPNSRPFE
jgi:hypothetical protein